MNHLPGLISYLFAVFVGFLGSLLGVTSVGLVAFAHALYVVSWSLTLKGTP
jgi:hypothetical protein